jgi:hypothetical protein
MGNIASTRANGAPRGSGISRRDWLHVWLYRRLRRNELLR